MEIKVNIPKNDFVQPTEVREDVVQLICDHILKWMRDDMYDLFVKIRWGKYELYLNRSDDGTTSGFSREYDEKCNPIRIRTIEMETVFDVFQRAGYYIFKTSNTDGNITYVFSKKPYFAGEHAILQHFTVFID